MKHKIKTLFIAAACGVGSASFYFTKVSYDILDRLNKNGISSIETNRCIANNLAPYQIAADLLPGNHDEPLMVKTLATMIECRKQRPSP